MNNELDQIKKEREELRNEQVKFIKEKGKAPKQQQPSISLDQRSIDALFSSPNGASQFNGTNNVTNNYNLTSDQIDNMLAIMKQQAENARIQAETANLQARMMAKLMNISMSDEEQDNEMLERNK